MPSICATSTAGALHPTTTPNPTPNPNPNATPNPTPNPTPTPTPDRSGKLTILAQRVVTHDAESGAESRLYNPNPNPDPNPNPNPNPNPYP